MTPTRWAAFLVIGLLTACAMGPQPVSTESPDARKPPDAQSTPAVTAPSDGSVSEQLPAPTVRLIASAVELRRAGDLEASFARLERALRISPQAAEVYLELARNYQVRGDSQPARSAAERGLAYCAGSVCLELRRFLGK
ncbi:MAG: tetratricopeptide repeat protein [Pseudomonadota bacterium]